MKKIAIIYAFIFALIAFGQTAWAQNYITDVLVIGDPSQGEASDRFDSFVSQGWTGINHNLNSGTDDGYYIYLLYKTDVSPYSSETPITDLYLRVSDSNDGPAEFTLDGRTYQLSYHFGHPNFINSKGDLNCGASGKYIHLYYTKDAFPIGRVVTSISVDNTSNSTAVCENGGTTPCDLNKGAGGDFIYLHVNKSMTGDVGVVYTEAELLDALTLNNAIIRLGNYIDLSTVLLINFNRTVTIDLDGYILDRGLTKHIDHGEVFNVANGSMLNLSNGTVTGGWGNDGGAIQNNGTTNLTGVIISGNVADDRGGGIGNKNGATLTMTDCTITNNTCKDKADPRGGGGLFNASGATATLTNVTFTGNTVAQYGGAGICNYGTLTLDGCTITGNAGKSDGGGIWTNGTLNIQGAMTITGNTIDNGLLSNLYLKSGKVVTVTGSLAGSNIGIYMQSTGTFTSGYSTYHSGTNPNTIFTSDQNSNVSMDINSQEGQIDLFYIERDWEEDLSITSTTRTLAAGQYTVLNGGGDVHLNSGFYVVKGNVTYGFIYMEDGGEHHLILCDGAILNAKHINVEGNNKLFIYGQIKDLGQAIVKDMDGEIPHAGIGGRGVETGTIVIHGGYVQAQGGNEAHFTYSYGGAGIGGASYGNGGTINILGGTVVAWASGDGAAGIGGGYDGNGADVAIRGGRVIAEGYIYGPGIGAGYNASDIIDYYGTFTMTGGHVEAYGHADAAGIGGGRDTKGSIVNISGGYVFAKGGNSGAGIGSGCESWLSERVNGNWVEINGGKVEAYGGGNAAGIGGGQTADGATVIIRGGEVIAVGMEDGAGIGGGEDGKGGATTITGGTVIAKAGKIETGHSAIGPGYDNDILGFLNIGGDMMVRSADGSVGPFEESLREGYCRDRSDVRVEPCTHEGVHQYYPRNEYLEFHQKCPHCSQDRGTVPYTFLTAGNWDEYGNWLGHEIPFTGTGANVVVKAAATIGTVADVGNITLKNGGSITIADGGQLLHNNAGVKATVQKTITGYDDNDGGWNFIASPLTGNITPKVENGFLVNEYDLYFYDEPRHYWRNFKPEGFHHDFNIEPQKGYLYANDTTTTLSFNGTLQAGTNGTYTVENLGYASKNENLKGFNLVGNPFACNATITDGNGDPMSFYVIDGRNVVPNTGSTLIPPCTGVMVKATDSGQSVTFTKTTALQNSQQNQLQIMLSQAVSSRSTAMMDKAIVSFNESDKLEKFHFTDGAKVYIPQDGKDYAIASFGTDVARNVSTEIPVNFKATKNGTYTITVNPEGVNLAYLHLIDNMTGADVDLLATKGGDARHGDARHCVSTYTFTAKTTDYASRFKLVFSTIEDADGDDDAPFAYISNGEIIVIADASDASLQVVDVMGRVVRTVGLSQCGSRTTTSGMTPGAYVLRLINGDNIRTQKIIIE